MIVTVVVGLLALGVTASPASASQLTVTTSGSTVESYSSCDNLTLAAAAAGAHSGNNYTQVTISGFTSACVGLPTTVYIHDSSGAVIGTGSGSSALGSQTFTTSSYKANKVTTVVVRVNGWLFVASWTGGNPPPPAPFECDGVLMSDGQVVTGTTCTLSGTVQYSYLDPYNGGNPYWGTPIYYGTVSANISFNPGGYMSASGWVQYQDITLWRYTVDLTTMGGSAQYMNSLSGGFYLYKNDNTALAPGEDCSNATAVTFQEDVAGSSPSSGFVVSPRPIAWMPASSLLCHG